MSGTTPREWVRARREPTCLAWRSDARVIEPTVDELATLEGHYAFHLRDGDAHVLARDPLGVHKRFFAVDGDGHVDDDRLLARLLERHAPEDVFSVPSSAVLRVDRAGITLEPRAPLEFALEGDADSLVARIGARLDEVFDRLADALSDREVWVTLSGGLDSSTVAALAAERFPKLRAITFRLDDGPLHDDEDLAAARRVAAHLGLPLFEAVVSPEHVLGLLDDALVHGQDWRDFNVHCALVNAALAHALRDADAPVVLTGDGANELFADYSPEQLEGRTYYDLPRLDRGRLRRFLVRGLDAGDREVGPFAQHGAEVVQPHLLAADAYACLPDAFVEDRVAKQRLAEKLVGTRLPRFVLERPKVRAQCAREGTPGGTLKLLAEAGIDQSHLRRRFAELLGVSETWATELIRAGVYRAPRTARPASDRTASERAASDRAASDRAASDRAASDTAPRAASDTVPRAASHTAPTSSPAPSSVPSSVSSVESTRKGES